MSQQDLVEDQDREVRSLSPEQRRKDARHLRDRLEDQVGPGTRAWEVAKRTLVGTYNDGFIHAGNLAYLSMLADPRGELTQDLRRRFGGPVILNSGFSEQTTFEEVEKLLIDDLADVVAVGRPFLANPDLAERWRTGASLNEPDPATFYGGGAEGYTDYPTLTSA